MEYEIGIDYLEQVVDIESSVFIYDVIQQKETVEISPTTIYLQPVYKNWDVLNIDSSNATYYYVQSTLDNEYKIQRINKSTYEIDYNYSSVDEWLNRTTIIYDI
jgi:hypothetical protein